MESVRGPVPPASALEHPTSPPWRTERGRSHAASANSSKAHGRAAMRPLVTRARADLHECGPGTPDVELSPQHGPSVRRTHLPALACGRTADAHVVRLAMPAARMGALPDLSECSPPLSPTHDDLFGGTDGPFTCALGGAPYRCAPADAPSPTVPSAYALPDAPFGRGQRHMWSTAQADADARMHDARASSAATGGGKHAWQVPDGALPLPVLGDRASPPTSLDSIAPSLCSSRGSSDEDAVSTAPRLARASRTAVGVLQWLAAPFRTRTAPPPRADVAPGVRQTRYAALAPHMWKLALLVLAFIGATALLGVCVSTLPLRLPTHLAQLTLAEIQDMCAQLRTYSRSSTGAMTHVFLVLAALFTWKQAFCVPGSLIMNIVFGAMYGAYAGCVYASVLTATGGVLCYLLASPFTQVVARVPGIAKPLNAMRAALTASGAAPADVDDIHAPGTVPRASVDAPVGSLARPAAEKPSGVGQNLWTYLLFLRLLPIVPYGMMNIACGVLQVPLAPYAVTLGIGSVPWNFCTTQIGELLQDVVAAIHRSAAMSQVGEVGTVAGTTGPGAALAGGALSALMDRLWTVDMMVKLLLLSCASMLPFVLQHVFRGRRLPGAAVEEGFAAGAAAE
ncbi:hypothetical protein MSPP1_000927 [Malassezia sp. CBS 17886]|nr:hypothetical protein MSPP1_000927 [Malassezia sp. CBS 17886]